MDLFWLFLVCFAFSEAEENLGASQSCKGIEYVTRVGWNADSPSSTTPFLKKRTPVKYFFVHHSDGYACNSIESCKHSVKEIQLLHMNKSKTNHEVWNDIGYSFLIDRDGRVYEGRGWRNRGSHTNGFNNNAFAACFLGNFMTRTPSSKAIEALEKLIQCGIAEGKIHRDYVLRGHRDARVTVTVCPGDALYDEMQSFPHYPNKSDPCWKYSTIERCSWLGDNEGTRQNITHPVPYVIVHTSDGNCEMCTNFSTCSKRALQIKTIHAKESSDKDIGFHFLIGGDGNVYDGRGTDDAQHSAWEYLGHHAGGQWDSQSYGITFIGNFDSTKPNITATDAFTNLLECGVRRGYLRSDYVIHVHSDIITKSSKCIGGKLKEEIVKLDHYQPFKETYTITDAAADESHCNFQKDTCEWIADKTNGGSGWRRQRGAADTAGLTGPLTDADKQINGYYLLADASNKFDRKIKLTSAKYPFTELQRYYCMKFWYHMYGQDVKGLSLWVYVHSPTHVLSGGTLRKKVLTLAGNQGSNWHSKAATIDIETEWAIKVNFEFVAEFGNYKGDIALDNIDITKGKCK